MTKYSVFILSAVFLLCATAFAQTKKDSVLKVIAGEVCTELSANNPSFKNKEDLSVDLGLAIMPSFVKHQDELKEFFDADITNGAAMEDFGKQVGMRLMTDCPHFLAMFKDNKDAFTELADASSGKKEYSGVVSGTLIKIVPGDFTYFIVKNKNGKSEKIWWQEYFNGAEKITTSNLNKPIKVSFIEKDIYNATLKDYIKQKIAAAVE